MLDSLLAALKLLLQVSGNMEWTPAVSTPCYLCLSTQKLFKMKMLYTMNVDGAPRTPSVTYRGGAVFCCSLTLMKEKQIRTGINKLHQLACLFNAPSCPVPPRR